MKFPKIQLPKIRLPKWSTVVGGILAALPAIRKAVPEIDHSFPGVAASPLFQHALGVVSVVGAVAAVYGTPPHANQPQGAVVEPGEPPVKNPVA